LIGLQEKLFDYCWSSYPWYAALAGRPRWFECGRVFGELGWEDTRAGRRAYAERMRGRAVEEREGKESALGDELRRGWCLGKPSFRERMLQLLERKQPAPTTGERELDASLRRSHGEKEAARLLQRGLQLFGLKEEDLAGLKKNDSRKRAIATLIRRHTIVPNRWIAQALHLGHVSRVSRCWAEANDLSSLLEENGGE
jgi:hypothetical protein